MQLNTDMLLQVRAEMDYRLDVCLVTKGGHTQHLREMHNNLGEFIFPSADRMLQSIRVCRFDEMCREITNNPVLAKITLTRGLHSTNKCKALR
jgi:hypothetical protein